MWDRMARVLSGYNPESLDRVVEWPLRDVLLGYEHHLREQARIEYHLGLKMYAALAPHTKSKTSPPKIPRILEES